MGDWKIGTLGCFSNIKLSCVAAILAPCLIGKMAEDSEIDDCLMGTIKSMIPIYNLIYFKQIRDKAAAANGIDEESCVSYLLKMFCCGCCTVVQTGNELGTEFPMGESIERQ